MEFDEVGQLLGLERGRAHPGGAGGRGADGPDLLPGGVVDRPGGAVGDVEGLAGLDTGLIKCCIVV